jgi:hypothetical protein
LMDTSGTRHGTRKRDTGVRTIVHERCVKLSHSTIARELQPMWQIVTINHR